eukprot:5862939-Pyramimonas_sp.AAC.1
MGHLRMEFGARQGASKLRCAREVWNWVTALGARSAPAKVAPGALEGQRIARAALGKYAQRHGCRWRRSCRKYSTPRITPLGASFAAGQRFACPRR